MKIKQILAIKTEDDRRKLKIRRNKKDEKTRFEEKISFQGSRNISK